MRKNLIIFATYDGLSTIFSGVGKVSESYISTFSKFIEDYNARVPDNSFHFIATDIFYANKVQDKDRFDKFRKENSFQYVALPTSSPGTNINETWGEAVWQSASLALATFIGTVSQNYSRVIVYCNDTIFMYVRQYLERCLPDSKLVEIYWMPHSLGAFFKDRYTDEGRIAAEKKSLAKFVAHNDRVIALNEYAEDVLIHEYEVPPASIDKVYNGINLRETMSLPNLNKRILLFGRCTPQKGFDIALPAILKFLTTHDYRIIMHAPTETSAPSYVAKIRELVDGFPIDKIQIETKFCDNEPIRILTALRNSFVVFPSQYETAPLAPLEAILYADPSVTILYSDIAPHREIFENQANCYSFPKTNINALFDLMVAVENKNDGRARSLNHRYNMFETVKQHLDQVINNK